MDGSCGGGGGVGTEEVEGLLPLVEDDGELRPLVMVMPKRFLVGVAVDAGLGFLGD